MPLASRTYLSELSQLTAMREFVGVMSRERWTRQADQPAIQQLLLALQKAAANVIEHAYAGEAGRSIDVTVETRADQICLTLRHDGLAFDPKAASPPAFDGRSEGGFGVYMMEQLTDEVRYYLEEDGRPAVRLVKIRTPCAQESIMELSVETIGDVTVATLKVEQFDAAYADEFKREIAPALGATRKLVLDLAAVQFVDSRACGAILSCLKRLGETGGELKICNVTPFVAEVFKLIRMQRICEILGTRDDAIRAFSGGSTAVSADGSAR